MNLQLKQPVFVWLLIIASACASAENIVDRKCKAIEPGIFETVSSSGIDVTITLTANAIEIENKFLRSVISEENGYRLENINQDSNLITTLTEIFSALYSEQVKLIDKKNCGLFFKQAGHEFYLLPSLNQGTYLLFEYSDIDPPEVYQLVK